MKMNLELSVWFVRSFKMINEVQESKILEYSLDFIDHFW